MPFSNLPKDANALYEKVYDASRKAGDSEEVAARKAWAAVKQGWKKGDDDKWHKKAIYQEQSLTIKKAYIDPKTGEKRWRADTSNTSNDLAGDNMTLSLFADFVQRINDDELAPDEYRSEFWEGGMPYLSVSHYTDLNGDAVPGVVDAVYVDGTYLKAKGRMHDNTLGNACWKSLCEDLEKIKKGESIDDKVRISIGFLDYGHVHKSNGYIFDRQSLDDICPECLKEIILGEYAGRAFNKGLLVHLAMTRVPMNRDTTIDPDLEVTRSMTTRKQDAASIIGEELAEELDEKAKLVGKSEALIIKSEEDEQPLIEEAKTKKEDEEASDEMEDDDEMEEDGEYKDKKKKMKSNVDLSSVMSAIEELRSAVSTPVVPDKPAHILDEHFEEFKSRFDEVYSSDLPADEKLRLIQEPFNYLGGQLVATMKSSAKKEEVVVKSDEGGADIVKALTDALQPLMQKLDLVLQNNTPITQSTIPPRRSVNPASLQTLSTVERKQTFTADEIAKRSVGLPY